MKIQANKNTEIEWKHLREKRNHALKLCDWTMLPDAPLSRDEVAAWKDYRQALRNLPQHTRSLARVKWPEPPMTNEGERHARIMSELT